MVGLVEIHSYKSGGFYLWHVPMKEAKRKQKELWADGYVVTFTKVL